MDDCLVAIPTYGRHDLTHRLLGQLHGLSAHTVVIDNRGDFEGDGVEVVRPERSLRWIGSANYALSRAVREGYRLCAVLNNDIEFADGGLASLALAFQHVDGTAVCAPTYDCYWPHQRRLLPGPARLYREVPFCDGTALMVSTDAIREVGLFDAETFSWHGYGADVDYGIRVRMHGMRSIAAEGSYVLHERRATIGAYEQDVERRIVAEYQGGLARKWGPQWRHRAGLGGPLVDPVWG